LRKPKTPLEIEDQNIQLFPRTGVFDHSCTVESPASFKTTDTQVILL
jgi:hypothetical protein